MGRSYRPPLHGLYALWLRDVRGPICRLGEWGECRQRPLCPRLRPACKPTTDPPLSGAVLLVAGAAPALSARLLGSARPAGSR